MTEQEIAALAKAVVAELGSNVVPGVLPARIGDWFQQAFEHGSREFRFVTATGPGIEGMITVYYFQPDGSLLVQLTTMTGEVFWSGVLRPVPGG